MKLEGGKEAIMIIDQVTIAGEKGKRSMDCER